MQSAMVNLAATGCMDENIQFLSAFLGTKLVFN